MADRPSAPSQANQASEKVKAEGDRDRDDTARTSPPSGRVATGPGRGRLDSREVREVLDEASEKHRRGEDVGASGFSNHTLAEEQEEQAKVPPRRTRKAGGA